MAQATNYKRTLGGSIGAGMKSVMGGNGRRYFILEHKVSSKYHKAGENQKIIVDQIEIGRDPKAQVRFDESFNTVSRKHAAIVRDGDNWKLLPLSQTNSTYLNGHKVDKEWYLQNGDEIQLSTNGPKLGFITPAGDKGLVKSIGMTARLNLFRKQALKPYKNAIAILSTCVLVGIVIAWWIIRGLGLTVEEQGHQIESQATLITELKDYTKKVEDNAAEKIAQVNSEKDALIKKVNSLQGELSNVKKVQQNISLGKVKGINNDALAGVLPNVYFIYTTTIEVTLPNGKSAEFICGEDDVPGWFGTGFLLDNGKFVTARHVIEAWNYFIGGNKVDEDLLQLNMIKNNGGKVKVNFGAISSSGNQLKFSSDQFTVNRSADKTERMEDGTKVIYAVPGNTDYAYLSTGRTGGLNFSKSESVNLKRDAQLTLLGFPNGFGVHPTSVNPVSSTVKVGIDGLEKGIILTSETNMDHGNSGGPALVLDENGKYIVIGIASAIYGKNLGMIVPISVIN